MLIQHHWESTCLPCKFEPCNLVLDHLAEQQILYAFATRLMRCFEPRLIVAVDGRLPEKLDKASKIHRIVIVGLEKLIIDL